VTEVLSKSKIHQRVTAVQILYYKFVTEGTGQASEKPSEENYQRVNRQKTPTEIFEKRRL
jgi:hypothetical protein